MFFTSRFKNSYAQEEAMKKLKDAQEAQNILTAESQRKILELEKDSASHKQMRIETEAKLAQASNKIAELEEALKKQISQESVKKEELTNKINQAEKTIAELKNAIEKQNFIALKNTNQTAA